LDPAHEVLVGTPPRSCLASFRPRRLPPEPDPGERVQPADRKAPDRPPKPAMPAVAPDRVLVVPLKDLVQLVAPDELPAGTPGVAARAWWSTSITGVTFGVGVTVDSGSGRRLSGDATRLSPSPSRPHPPHATTAN